MIYYYLAFLIMILEILMFASIVFIPIVIFLRDKYEWFEAPFRTAWWWSN